MINIKGLDKAQLLVELYNHSHQQGMGMLQPARNLTVEDAKKLLEQTTSFDYLYGKVMKVDLSGDEFEEWLYDRDNGQGMAKKIVDDMRKELEKAAVERVEQGVKTTIPESPKFEEQPQIDPRTKFVVGSEEYNNNYYQKINRGDKYYDYQPIDKKDKYLEPKPIDRRELYLEPKPVNNYIEKQPISNVIMPKEINESQLSRDLPINNSILVDENKTLNLVRQTVNKRGLSRFFAEIPKSFDEVDETTFTKMQSIDQAHQNNFISRDVAIEMIVDLFERQGFCKRFEKYIDSVLMARLKELFELIEIKYQDLLNALNTGKIDQAQFTERMAKLRELEANSMSEIVLQNETLKGQSK